MGGAVADWFGGWLSSQNNVKLDWGQVFKKVDSLTYAIDAADKVNMDMKLNCATPADAAYAAAGFGRPEDGSTACLVGTESRPPEPLHGHER